MPTQLSCIAAGILLMRLCRNHPLSCGQPTSCIHMSIHFVRCGRLMKVWHIRIRRFFTALQTFVMSPTLAASFQGFNVVL